MMKVLDLPRELIALVGQKLGVADRCACRLAHRHFAHINDNITYHELTITTLDNAKERLETCVRLKPKLDFIVVHLDGLNASIDLSPLRAIQEVHLHIARCDVYPTGIDDAHVYVLLQGTHAVNESLHEFLIKQKEISVSLHAEHGRLLMDEAITCKVQLAVIMVNHDGAVVDVRCLAECAHVEVSVRCHTVTIPGFHNVTHLQVWGLDSMDVSNVRTWLNTETLTSGRLKQVECANTVWSRARESAVSHVVNMLHEAAPKTRLLLDPWHSGILPFVEYCVPSDMNVAFVCGLDVEEHGHDSYVAARIASMILKNRNIPLHCGKYTPPQHLQALSRVSDLFEHLVHDIYRFAWYMAKFVSFD